MKCFVPVVPCNLLELASVPALALPRQEILTMGSTCLSGASQARPGMIFQAKQSGVGLASSRPGPIFEAPAGLDKFTDRLKDVMSWWIEAGQVLAWSERVHSKIFNGACGACTFKCIQLYARV